MSICVLLHIPILLNPWRLELSYSRWRWGTCVCAEGPNARINFRGHANWNIKVSVKTTGVHCLLSFSSAQSTKRTQINRAHLCACFSQRSEHGGRQVRCRTKHFNRMHSLLASLAALAIRARKRDAHAADAVDDDAHTQNPKNKQPRRALRRCRRALRARPPRALCARRRRSDPAVAHAPPSRRVCWQGRVGHRREPRLGARARAPGPVTRAPPFESLCTRN